MPTFRSNLESIVFLRRVAVTSVSRIVRGACAGLASTSLAFAGASEAAPSASASVVSGPSLGAELGLWSVLPFLGVLLSIAILPLFAHHWWEKNRNRALVSFGFAVPVAAYLLLAHGAHGGHVLLEKLHEYVSFVVLLASLFVITGGIYIRGSLSGTPLVNTAILAIGGALASFIGTTGASMLLLRPLLRANESRQKKTHIVIFFIFVVSNCGGLLTPLGDPPLYLGFLKGVPFGWTFGLWKEWLVVNVALLAIFNVWDQRALNQEEKRRPGAQLERVMQHEPLRIDGLLNFVWLLGIVGVIYASGEGLGTGGEPWPIGTPEAAMLGFCAVAWFTTRAENRSLNKFSWGPIQEVAILFAGIFVTMAPALLILNSWGQGERVVFGAEFEASQPWQYFWLSGGLSSFLDNAPTYLTFTATAAGKFGVPANEQFLSTFLAQGDGAALLLAAISCGSVFMGANTYIGNGPNFMVKAIAEENGVRMPSFFGYMAYSCLILLPLFGVITWLFFTGDDVLNVSARA
ncbi:MAG: sodium:proton antiporter [Planctomycetes bacterium]|nr:sodium:proton antiporter [Planctomycetota bacterium]